MPRHYSLSGKLLVALVLACSGIPPLYSQTVSAGTRQEKSRLHTVPMQLKTALMELKERYQVDILFEEDMLDNISIEAGLVGKEQTLEENLRRMLKPTGLRFKRLKKGAYLILPAKRSASDPLGAALPAPDSASSEVLASTTPSFVAAFTVAGQVTGDNGESLPGVSVVLKGTTTGTTTDGGGNYRIELPDGTGTLVFSFIGYVTEEVAVGSRTTVDVSLVADIKSLGEVVVVGYGTVKKSDLTGSVAKIGEADIKATPIVAIDRALQGRTAGVLVTQNSSRPGGGTTIRIRGTGSFTAGNEPLYVIDGYPIGDLNSINPNDIESVDVLKDASATAIYGSRGSNGVVIVTTKRGKAGESNVDFESYYGIQVVRRTIPMLNARQFAEFTNEARINGGGQPYFDGSSVNRPVPSSLGAGTDWQDEVFQRAPIQNYQLSLAGGSAKTRYAISGNIYDQQGLIVKSYFKRYTFRTNLDHDISSRIKVGLSMQGSFTKANEARTETDGQQNAGVTGAALSYPPTFPVYNPDGTYYSDQGTLNGQQVDNPVGIAKDVTSLAYSTRVLANVFADIEIVKGLRFRTSWGANLYNTKNNFYATRLTLLGRATNGSAAVGSGQSLNWLNENTLSYDASLGTRHRINTLAGYTTQGYHNESLRANAANFNDDFASFNNLGAGATLLAPASSAAQWSLVSYLARLNYTFADRFLLTLTARADGSSRFGPKRKYGFFPSGALGWRLINEKFMQGQGLFSDLKLRVSYGLTGNQEIGDYSYLSSIVAVPSAFGGALQIGGAQNGISNSALRWEKNAQFDLGADFSLLKNRLQFTVDYYIKTTSDLLIQVDISQTTGFSTSLQNIGKIENRGIELSISSINLDTERFKWNTDFNISFNRNKVLSLDKRAEFTGGDNGNVSNFILTRIGEPIGNFYGRVVEGIFQNQGEIDASAQPGAKPGDFRFKNLNGDKAINDADRQIIGNPLPDFFGGFNNTLSYRGFDLNIFIQGTYGNEILNFQRFELLNLNGQNNQSAEALNRWTATNPSNVIPRANSAGGQRIFSTFQVEDGSYLRLKNLSLGYNLPTALLKHVFLRSAKIYVAAQNYLTLTAYKGYDPEVNRFGTTSSIQGFDYGAYPASKTFLVGLNLKF